MDLQTICDEIADLANDETLGSAGTNYARTKAWVRDVYYLDILSRRTDWWFLKQQLTISTVANTVAYVLPGGANIKKVKEIKVRGGNAMIGLSQHDVDTKWEDRDEVGQPQYYWHKYRSSGSDWIEVYPKPDAVYTLDVACINLPVNLTANTDEPSLPDEFHYLLVKGGYIKALKHNQDPNLQIEMAEYEQAIKRLISQNARDDYKTDTWWK